MRRPALLVLLVLLVAACRPAATRSPSPSPAASPRAGAIEKVSPEQYRSRLKSMKGTPVVVNFWASWCVPCIAEMPRIVASAKRYGDSVRFLGVDVEDVGSEAETFASRFQMPFPSVADPRGEIRKAERVVGLPTTQFYRADGGLGFVHAGEIQATDLEDKIKELLRVASPAAP